MENRDLYEVLGVSRTASDSEIRKAYRELARKYHPDRNRGDKRSEERFKDISYAKEILTNKEKRKLYDEFGEIGVKEGFNPEAYRQYRDASSRVGATWEATSFEELFGNRDFDFSAGSRDIFGKDFMESIFGGVARGRGRRHHVGQDITAELTISFVEALQGVERHFTFQDPDIAGGTRTIRARIPAGVKDGGRVRLKGQGSNGGDLVLLVRVEAHPHYWREGNDLHLNLPVTIAEAYRGARIEIPTANGKVTIQVPRGVKGGARLRARGKGVKPHGRGRTGDLIAHVQIRLPEAEDESTKRAIDEIEKSYRRSPREDLNL